MTSKIKKLLAGKKTCLFVFFTVINLYFTPVFACDAPVEAFCVDFYKGRNLEGKPRLTREIPTIKYNWERRRPARHIRRNNFSARWRGKFNFTKGLYRFRVHADEGVRLLIDGQLIIDHWKDGQGIEYFEKVTPGYGIHLVEVEYYEATGVANIEVDWKQVFNSNETVSFNHYISNKKIKSLTPKIVDKKERFNKKWFEKNKSKAKVFSKFKKNIRKKNAPIGVNVSSFSYWSSTVPFKDLMMQSGRIDVYKKSSNERCSTQPPRDKNGYPSFLPKDCIFRIWSAFHIMNEYWPENTPPYKPGHYVLLYQGQGKIRLGWDVKKSKKIHSGRIEFYVPEPKVGIQIEVMATNTSNPIRDMHIVHIDDEDTYLNQPFNETWLSLLKPFDVIRFMDWGAVSQKESVYRSKAIYHTAYSISLPDSAPTEDGAFDDMVVLININNKWPRVFIDKYDGSTRTLYLKSPINISQLGKQPTVDIYKFVNKEWEQRTKPDTFGQGSNKGVAFEYMIKLANILNIDPWITIPTAANDDFVESLALLIKNTLNPNLKCYIEYSNETWNFSFPGYHYSEAKARQLELTGTWIPADAWQAYRAVEIFKIFNRVFDEADLHEARSQSRLVRVLSSQTAWLDRAKRVMDWTMPNNDLPTQGNQAYKFADAWAMTTYFYLDKDKPLESLGMDALIAAQIDNINALFGTRKDPGLIRKILVESKARGLQMVAYEGGTHLVAPNNKAELVAKVALINKNPQMEGVYAVLLAHWNKLYQEYGASSVGILNHYSDISRYGKHGYWGLLQSTYQDPATSPRYQAIKDYVSAP